MSLSSQQKKGIEKILPEIFKVLQLERCMDIEKADIAKRFRSYCREMVNDYELGEWEQNQEPKKPKSNLKKSSTSKKKDCDEDGTIAAKKKVVLAVPKKSTKKKNA